MFFVHFCFNLLSLYVITSMGSCHFSISASGKCANRLLASSGLPLIARQMKVCGEASMFIVVLVLWQMFLSVVPFSESLVQDVKFIGDVASQIYAEVRTKFDMGSSCGIWRSSSFGISLRGSICQRNWCSLMDGKQFCKTAVHPKWSSMLDLLQYSAFWQAAQGPTGRLQMHMWINLTLWKSESIF